MPDPCLDDREVQALASGALPHEAAVGLLAHIGQCDSCRALVAQSARASSDVVRAAADVRTVSNSSVPVEPPLLLRGATVDRYVVDELVGQGGMGVVYAAYDPQLDRRVAVKLVRADQARSPLLRERLVREAQMMARAAHVNVITVYDAGIVDDRLFIAMELVAGRTLGEWLRAERRSWRSVVAQLVCAGRGLAAAHALGIVHRDFKPDNVLVGDDGRVRVSDFGLAVASTPRECADGRLVGTPAYMAPEQRRGEAVDARSDQFSFCVALGEALTGARPAVADDGEPVRLGPWGASPRAASGRVPVGLRRAIARGLSPSPAARFASMAELLGALERYAAGGRERAAAAAASLLAVAAIAIGVTLAVTRGPHGDAAPVSVASVRRLTYTAGCEEYPSFAAAGALVVFDGEVDGTQQLFTLEPRSGATRQLTFGRGGSRVPLVSPDGRRIVYEHHEPDGPRQLRIRGVDGSGERLLGDGSTLGGSWLDDRNLAIIGPGGTLLRVDVDAAEVVRRPLFADPQHHRFGLTAAFADGTLATSWWAPPSGLGFGLVNAAGLRVLVERVPYTDGALQVAPANDAFYYVRRAGTANELVRMPRVGGAPLVVGGGIAPARGFAIARDGTHLVFSTCASRAQLWRVGDGGEGIALFRPQPWSDIAPAPIDDHRLLFASDRSGHDQLYVTDTRSGAAPTPLSARDVEEGAPSADGRSVVYSAHDPGGVWLASLDGSSSPRRLTDGPHDEAPQLSHDGNTVFFTRDEAVFAVARAGGAARLVARPGREPAPSRVDERLFFLQRLPGADRQRIGVIDAKGAVVPLGVTLPSGNSWSLTASPDGRSLALVHEGFEIIEVPLDGRGPARVRARLPRWASSLSYAYDGKALWASLEALDGDLWMTEGRFR